MRSSMLHPPQSYVRGQQSVQLQPNTHLRGVHGEFQNGVSPLKIDQGSASKELRVHAPSGDAHERVVVGFRIEPLGHLNYPSDYRVPDSFPVARLFSGGCQRKKGGCHESPDFQKKKKRSWHLERRVGEVPFFWRWCPLSG